MRHHERRLQAVEHRSLGWRFWYLPGLGAELVMATKPATPAPR